MKIKTLRDVCLDLVSKYRENDRLVDSGLWNGERYCEGICVSLCHFSYHNIDKSPLKNAIEDLPGSTYKWTRKGVEGRLLRAEFLEKFAETLEK